MTAPTAAELRALADQLGKEAAGAELIPGLMRLAAAGYRTLAVVLDRLAEAEAEAEGELSAAVEGDQQLRGELEQAEAVAQEATARAGKEHTRVAQAQRAELVGQRDKRELEELE